MQTEVSGYRLDDNSLRPRGSSGSIDYFLKWVKACQKNLIKHFVNTRSRSDIKPLSRMRKYFKFIKRCSVWVLFFTLQMCQRQSTANLGSRRLLSL